MAIPWFFDTLWDLIHDGAAWVMRPVAGQRVPEFRNADIGVEDSEAATEWAAAVGGRYCVTHSGPSWCFDHDGQAWVAWPSGRHADTLPTFRNPEIPADDRNAAREWALDVTDAYLREHPQPSAAP